MELRLFFKFLFETPYILDQQVLSFLPTTLYLRREKHLGSAGMNIHLWANPN